MINFVVLDGVQIVPLDSIPIFTKKYCREQGKKYRSENKIVEEWIKDLPTTGLFTDKQIHSSIFLLDSGYDVKAVQKGIIGIGADFVMSLKSNRVVSGKQIQILFRANRRWLPAKLIRLTAGSGGKGSRRTFSVRTAAEVHLKGVGLITAVCSKGLSRSKKPKKYLGTSCLEMSTRQIVQWYSMRWRIETWHREVKQNFGFGDCRSSRFVAIESHITFSLTAYIIQKNRDTRQRSVEEVTLINELKKIRTASTKFGSVYHLKSLINSALQGHAA